MTTIAIERPDSPDVWPLIEALDAYQQPLYPPESHHGIDLPALLQPAVRFAVARDAIGMAIGCGAIVLHADYGELKRMFVLAERRGQGIAPELLGFLEAQAQRGGCTLLRLETGVSQPEALGFYTRSGYRRRGPFGGYSDDPLSVFMEKTLT